METTMNDNTSSQSHKNKVVFILGATGTGKSRLSVHLATHFGAEIVNSDKIQLHKGLDIITNKISEEESLGVKHHLLGAIDPNDDFSADDFCHHALNAISDIMSSGKMPIIAGGSNTYIEKLIEDPKYRFKSKYECCFIWLYVELPVLKKYVYERVDQMVDDGLVDEARKMFVPGADHTRGIRRAIGVPEMEKYFLDEMKFDGKHKKKLLEKGIQEIKDNTYTLAVKQTKKIEKLRHDHGWPVHRIDSTVVFQKRDKEAKVAWEKLVKNQSLEIIKGFLN